MNNELEEKKILFKEWYFQKVEPNITISQKLDLLKRISEINLKIVDNQNQKTNYLDIFPELAVHSEDKGVSRIKLLAVKEAILEELHFPA